MTNNKLGVNVLIYISHNRTCSLFAVYRPNQNRIHPRTMRSCELLSRSRLKLINHYVFITICCLAGSVWCELLVLICMNWKCEIRCHTSHAHTQRRVDRDERWMINFCIQFMSDIAKFVRFLMICGVAPVDVITSEKPNENEMLFKFIMENINSFLSCCASRVCSILNFSWIGSNSAECIQYETVEWAHIVVTRMVHKTQSNRINIEIIWIQWSWKWGMQQSKRKVKRLQYRFS